MPLSGSEMPSLQHEPYAFAAALFFYNADSDYRHIPWHLKYEGGLAAGRFFSRMLGARLAASTQFSDVDVVIPVPLHWTRRWRRGYNQAEVIARGVAEGLGSGGDSGSSLGLPLPVVTDLLRRARYTRTQTRLDAEGKRRNVAGAFVLRPGAVARLQKAGIRHLLIVDDVMTTGATLSEAIRPLLPHFRVSVATIAFVE